MSEANNNFSFGPLFDPEVGAKMDGKYRFDWVAENVAFSKRFRQQVPLPESGNHINSSLKTKTIFWFWIFLIIMFVGVGIRLVYLQLWQGSSLFLSAEGNRQRIIPIPAERGIIYDRNDVPLTENIPNFSLAIVPQDLPRKKEDRGIIIKHLSELSGITTQEVAKILEEYSSYRYESIVMQENIDYDKALKIIIESANLSGIQIQRGSKRNYLNYNSGVTSTPFSLSHVIGYIGKLNKDELTNLYHSGYYPADSIGKTGVEKIYETQLRGVFGRRRIEVDASGKEQSVLAEEAPIPGQHLKLAIDLEMQKKLESIINNKLNTSGKKRAAGIVLNPQNGEILAMVSLPAFDNNDFSGGISYDKYSSYINNEDKPLFNRVISGLYPSGSVIKPVMAAAALSEHVITAATSFLSNGGLRIGAWFFPDWQAGGHGVTNVRKALASSVNTFFYYIGGGYGEFKGLGVTKIDQYLNLFGFAKKTGIDLLGEQAGNIPTPENKKQADGTDWYVGDTYNLSIGQGGLLVTPIQIAAMTAAVANGGTLYEPHVGLALVDPVTKKSQPIAPKVIKNQLVSPDIIQTIQLGMRDCVIYGSCRQLSALPFAAAGKTGTAQWNKNKSNHAWFTSFAPFDKPEIVVTILVEEGGEGSSISAPIAYEFYKWWGSRR